jgi:pyruvate,water dikinase
VLPWSLPLEDARAAEQLNFAGRDDSSPAVSETSVSKTLEPTGGPGILTLALNAVRRQDLARAGGKAAQLGEMIAAGLPVPSGFVITTEAWRRFAQARAHHLPGAINGESEPASALGPGPDHTRSRLNAAPMPPEVVQAIRTALGPDANGAWAVRSSATAEDSAEASFAGQHDSFLEVRGQDAVLAAVKKCWLSLFSERAVSYRKRKGLAPDGVQMAVIVQRFVPTTAAGVMFTADPSGNGEAMVIEAARGLGEAVVHGQVAPERIYLSHSSAQVLRREAGQTPSPSVPGEEVTAERTPPTDRLAAEVLSDAAAVRLARLALEVERVLGRPLDLEWGVSGTTLWLFQARPVTKAPVGDKANFDRRQVWTNANTGEVLPDVVTPLTWSLVRLFAGDLFEVLSHAVGVRINDQQVFSLIAGRAYFNFNTACALNRRVPGAEDGDLTNLFGGHQEAMLALKQLKIEELDLPKIEIQRWRVAMNLIGVLPRFLFRSTQCGRAAVAAVRHQNDKLARLQPGQLSDAELLAAIQASFASSMLRRLGVFESMGTAALSCALLFKLCDRWFGDEGPGIANRLLAGLGGLEDAESGHALWRLAEQAAGDPRLKNALRTTPNFADLASRLEGSGSGMSFLAAWRAFMNRHGHHARGEIELFTPRWSERPDFVLEWLRSCMQAIESGRPSPSARQQTLERDRTALERDCLNRLNNPLKRTLFRLVLRRARAGSQCRENLKSELVRWLALLRHLLLELGWRWFTEGRLADANDIFFLEYPELQDGNRGAPSNDLRPLAAARRAEYERNLRITPPSVIIGHFDPDHCPPEIVNGHQRTFQGLGVGAGVVTGRARVILRPDGGETLQPGEILVAPSTDPGWTPYFLTAAGLVMDLGGILSHGCIVAREYGIPAVVNVGPATRIIQNGQWLEVDANQGRVTVFEGPAGSEPK